MIGRRLGQLARRRRTARRLRVLVPALAIAASVAAVMVLAVRLAWPAGAALAPWVAAAAALPLAAAPFIGRRRERAALLAGHLDRLVDGRGIVMALAAEPRAARDPGWEARVRGPLEALRWPPHDWRRLPLALVAAAGLAGALLVPQRLPPEPTVATPWAAHFSRFARRLDAAEARGAAPAAELERLSRQLERLEAAAARGGMSQTAWEGLDRLERDLDRALSDAQARLAEALAAARTATEPRAGDPAPGSAEELAAEAERRRRERDRLAPKDPPADPSAAAPSAPDERKRMLERLTREREQERLEQLAQGLAGLAEAAPGLLEPLDPAAAQALSRALDHAGALDALSPELREALERMLRERAPGDVGEPGAGEPEPGPSGPAPDPAELARALEALRLALESGGAALGQLGAGEGLDAQLARVTEGLLRAAPGVSRGPGTSPLAHGRDPGVAPSPEALEALPPGARVNPDGSITLAITSRDPSLDPAALAPAARAALRAHDPSAPDARRARVAPRHRGAVARYFTPITAPPPPP